EPEALFASWDTLRSGRLKLNPRANRDDEFIELEGTPDLVVEVVSDSSTRKDLKLLRGAYARAGIPEYWLIDARSDEIRFEILKLSDTGYHATEPATAPWQHSAVLGVNARLTRGLNPIGRFSYALELQTAE